ncbi:hypothetical protein EN914_20160 [Mesorhizobium sp. M7A.F.Ca.CA.001.08.2.1]|nr:hypothetical protein EN914_20160 [Mesorhizobium sp. M7A.F.Ca.CA.001.08.2.1]
MTKKLDKSVAVVGAAWAESQYYDNAERWAHLFWDEDKGTGLIVRESNIIQWGGVGDWIA